eukprot:2624778-Alexandrium_andersonii.AAC.1
MAGEGSETAAGDTQKWLRPDTFNIGPEVPSTLRRVELNPERNVHLGQLTEAQRTEACKLYS